MGDYIELLIPVKDRDDVLLQELLVGALTYYFDKRVEIIDNVITIYVEDDTENMSFLYKLYDPAVTP